MLCGVTSELWIQTLGCCVVLQVQCTGRSPTISIDKCDGVQAYIPAALAEDPNFQVGFQRQLSV